MTVGAAAHASVLCDARDRVGESPVWSVSEQALYWVDIEGRQIRRYDWASGQWRSWRTPERVGCIGLRQGGGLIAAMESGVFGVDLPEGAGDGEARFDLLASAAHAGPNMRFNDGRCDAAGRLWVGSMFMDMGQARNTGALYRLAPSDAARADPFVMDQPVVTGLIVPNGLGFSPDRRTMYLSDSHPSSQAIWQFDFDIDSGTPTNQRLFVDMRAHPGRPDGAAVDADGCYWICANDAGMVHRFTPEGRLDRSVSLPVSKPAMCAFGGPDLATLFVTSIQPAQPAATHPDEQPLAGAVFMLDVAARGLPEPMFG